MQLPIDPKSTGDIKLLYELLNTKGLTEDYYKKVEAQIKAIGERSDAIERLVKEKSKKKREQVQGKPKQQKKLDARSYKHAAQNASIPASGVSIYGGWSLYKELKAEGLAPSPETLWWAFTQLPYLGQIIVLFLISMVILLFIGTLVDRYGKEFK